MDLTEFRATYPGLYQQAFDAGREADRERIKTLLALGEAAGNIFLAHNAIESGHSVADAMPRLRAFAGAQSDRQAAAFVKKIAELGLAPATRGGSTELDAADRLIARFATKADKRRDEGDQIADLMFGPEKGKNEPNAETPKRDVGDTVADLMFGSDESTVLARRLLRDDE